MPAQEVTFKSTSYTDTSKPKCIDLEKEYGDVWAKTTALQPGKTFRKYHAQDPFGLHN